MDHQTCHALMGIFSPMKTRLAVMVMWFIRYCMHMSHLPSHSPLALLTPFPSSLSRLQTWLPRTILPSVYKCIISFTCYELRSGSLNLFMSLFSFSFFFFLRRLLYIHGLDLYRSAPLFDLAFFLFAFGHTHLLLF